MLKIFLILIFIRPFISSLAFPYLNYIYSILLLLFLSLWLIKKRPSLASLNPLKYPLILFCLALAVSIITSKNILNSINELYKYVTGLVILLVVMNLSVEERKLLIRTIVFTGFIIAIFGVYQYFFGFNHLSKYIIKEKIKTLFTLDVLNQKRIFFPFVTPNSLAGYLILTMPLTLVNRNKYILLIPMLFVFLLTKSLGGLLSIILAMGIYLYLQNKLNSKKVLFLGAGLLLLIILAFILRTGTEKMHLHPQFSMTMRLSYWKDTLKIIQTHPFLGVGIGNFNLVQSRFAHNSYLQIWAEMGILGIISFLYLIYAILKSGLVNLNNSFEKNQIACFIFAYLAFLFHNFLDFTLFLPEISFIWWAICGLILNQAFQTHKLK